MRILSLLLFLFSLSVSAASSTGAVANTFQVGGPENGSNPCANLQIGNLSTTQLVTISAFIGNSTGSNYLMLTKWNSTGSSGQYQVPSGKSFRACMINVFCGTSNDTLTIGYGTAALGSDNTATPPTGVKYFSSGSQIPSMVTGPGGVVNSFPLYLEFPPSSFPIIQTNQGAQTYNVVMVGVEI